MTTTGELKVDNTVKISANATGGIAPYSYKFSIDSQAIQNYSSANTCNYKFTKKGDYNITVSVTDSGSPETRTLRGDSDRDGFVTIVDATYIQKWLAQIIPASDLNMANADADNNTIVDIVDATWIQKYLAGYKPW